MELKHKRDSESVRSIPTSTNYKIAIVGIKMIPDCENTNGRYYLGLPDGYRMIYDNDAYVGRYNSNLNEVI